MTTIRFANAQDGYAFGPGLWTTTDGGAKWIRARSLAGMRRFIVTSLAATSNGTVYALVAQGTPSGGTGGPLTLVRATAGRAAFSILRTVPVPEGIPNVIAAGTSAYVASGTDRLLSFGPVGEHSVPLPHPDRADTACTLAASDATALLAVCGSSVASGAMGDREAYGTTDGGRHWIRLPNPGRGSGYGTEGLAETANGHAVIATGDGGGTGLITTVDHAQSWRRTLSFTGNDGAEFKDLGFEDNLVGSVIYNPVVNGLAAKPRPTGVLFRTYDGGSSWQRVPY